MTSQAAAGKGHDAWVCVDNLSGHVLAAHCQCKAMLSEVCSHVAAVFALEATTRMEAERSCTSRPCACSSATSKKDTMVPIDQVELGRPGKRSKKLKTQPCQTSEKYSSSEREIFEAQKRVNPKAVVLRSIPKLDPEETDSASEDEDMHTFLRNARKSSSTRETFLDDMFLPLSEVQKTEKSTRLSSESPISYAARYGRITATTMSRVSILKPKFVTGFLDSVLQRRPRLNVESVRWGKDNERTAKEQYFEHMKTCHANFELHEIGFVIDPNAPFLGATPDGLWNCSCHGVGLVEIKCPWSLRELN
ncbi:uncharacterized protein LOC144116261 [Amblyomma americanum]